MAWSRKQHIEDRPRLDRWKYQDSGEPGSRVFWDKWSHVGLRRVSLRGRSNPLSRAGGFWSIDGRGSATSSNSFEDVAGRAVRRSVSDVRLSEHCTNVDDAPVDVHADDGSHVLPRPLHDDPVQTWFFKEALYGDPPLRHRMSWALGQILVISGLDPAVQSWDLVSQAT